MAFSNVNPNFNWKNESNADKWINGFTIDAANISH